MNPSYLLVLLGVVMVSYSGPLVKGGLLAGANPVTVATLPILCVYPFVQKYFVKGVMIGSIKG